MQRTILFVLGWMAFQPSISAEEIGFQFSGVMAQPALAFGHGPYPPGIPVSGRFVYETDSLATHDPGEGDCQGYRQQIFNGLSMTIAGVTFRADDYIVAVFNDDPMNQGADILTIIYSIALNPPPEKPLVVGNTSYSHGMLNVTLKNSDGTAFSSSAPPLQLPISAFGPQPIFGFLSDTPTDPSDDAIVMISSFHQLAAVSGDYDFDADVDGADFLIWQRTLGSAAELAADGNHNNMVDAGDLSTWRNHFGDGAPSVATVPEPSALAMLLLSCPVTFTSLRRAQYCGR